MSQHGQLWENSQDITHLSLGILNGHLQLTRQGAALAALLLQPQLALVDRLLTLGYDLQEFYVLGTRCL